MEKTKKPFGFKDQFGYVFGDVAGSMINLYIDMYILTFSTYVLGISTTWMAGLFLFAKIWDAVNDPLIGSLPDRFTIGRSGDKFKPFIKIAMIPLAVSVLMCFADVSSLPSTLKHLWIAAGYIIYGMSYTGTSMPYGAMASVITKDPVERTKLSRARSIGGTTVGVLFLPLVPMVVWNEDQTANAAGFFMFAVIAAVASLVFYTILLTCTTERYAPAQETENPEAQYKFFDVLKDGLKNRPLLGVMVATLGNCIASASMGGMASYLYKEYYHAPRLMALTSPLSIPILLICFPLIPKMAQKFGKRKVILASAVYNLIFGAFLFMIPIQNAYVYMVLNTLSSAGQTGFMMLIWAFVTDCIDYQEYKTQKRADGTLYSIYTFSRKIGTSITGSGTTFLLGTIGYVSGVQMQEAAVGAGIRNMVTLMPVVASAVEIIGIGLIYNLTKEKTEAVYAELEKRRAE